MKILSWKWIIQRLAMLAVMYSAVVVAIYVTQDDLLFIVQKYDVTPQQSGLEGFEEVQFSSEDNQTLYAWYSPAPKGAHTFVYFPGNADRLRGNAHLLKSLQAAGYGVFALQYRGYGKSSGEPSEQGLFLDAKASIEFLKTKMDERTIIVVGRSLGTGVAVYAAHEFSLAGMVLWSPYTSIEDVAQHLYWYLPVKLFNLARHKFDSMSRIAAIEEPLLMVYGGADGTIPPEFSLTLHDAAQSSKKMVLYPDAGHNGFDTTKVVSDIVEFARSLQ